MRSASAAGRLAPLLGLALLGVAAFAVFVLAFLPARVVGHGVERLEGVALDNLAGTVWRGDGDIAVGGEPLGRLQWRFAPAALFTGALGLDWRLRHPDYQLEGGLRQGFGGTAASVSGTVAAVALNRLLGQYHIRLAGAFEIDEVALRSDAGRWRAHGALRWNGGRTTYRLSGQSYDVEFPPLAATLGTEGDEVRFQAFLDGEASEPALIDARLDVEGWLHISVTRRFTRLAGKPWPGAGGEDEVVVTVAEQVLDTSGAAKMAL